MSSAHVVGHIQVKDAQLWADYRSRVPATLGAHGGEVVFRGHTRRSLDGELPQANIVAIRFPSLAQAQAWHASADYQALVPLRRRAADVVLSVYESD